MTSRKKLPQHEQDFADAMALKLRLNREQREKEQEQKEIISEAGDFRVSIARDVIRSHPGLTVEEVIIMMKEGGF